MRWFLLFSLFLVSATSDKFWAISHMANNENVLGWSLAAGANALEIDVEFSSAGEPEDSFHGSPCDCSCFISTGVCQYPISQICTGRRPIAAVLHYLMSHQQRGQVAMLYLDSKMDNVPEGLEVHAGEAMVRLAEEELFSLGYLGKLVIGGGKVDYLSSVIEAARVSRYHSQIFVAYDMYSTYSGSLEYLAGLNYTQKVASAGITACLQAFNNFHEEAVLGRINKAKGVVSEVILWTLDSEQQFDRYYDLGARGIISNNIAGLVQWARKRGYELYSPADPVAAATADISSLELDRGTCSCQLHGPGCIIDTPAAPHSACGCSYYNGTCAAAVMGCRDLADPACASPDASLSACILGSGNCDGYEEVTECECGYDTDGCRVTVAPSAGGRACRCTLTGVDKVCVGEVVECRQPDSVYCTNSTSLQSCLQGGGNCAGYPDQQCSCSLETAGCRISSPAAPDTACSCRHYAGQCSATTSICHQESSPSCLAPDASLASCLQGPGNCGGTCGCTCECSYQGGGCRVTRAPPPGTACRCSKFWWSCSGEVVRCGDTAAEECANPDTGMGSCHQGRGNCAGY